LTASYGGSSVTFELAIKSYGIVATPGTGTPAPEIAPVPVTPEYKLHIVSGAQQQVTNTGHTTGTAFRARFAPIVLELTLAGKPVVGRQIVYQIVAGAISCQLNNMGKAILSKKTDKQGRITVSDSVQWNPERRFSVSCYHRSGSTTFRASVGELGVQVSTQLTSVAPVVDTPVQGAMLRIDAPVAGSAALSGTLVFDPSYSRFRWKMPALSVSVRDADGKAVSGALVVWKATNAVGLTVEIGTGKTVSGVSGAASLKDCGGGHPCWVSTKSTSPIDAAAVQLTASYGGSSVTFELAIKSHGAI